MKNKETFGMANTYGKGISVAEFENCAKKVACKYGELVETQVRIISNKNTKIGFHKIFKQVGKVWQQADCTFKPVDSKAVIQRSELDIDKFTKSSKVELNKYLRRTEIIQITATYTCN